MNNDFVCFGQKIWFTYQFSGFHLSTSVEVLYSTCKILINYCEYLYTSVTRQLLKQMDRMIRQTITNTFIDRGKVSIVY